MFMYIFSLNCAKVHAYAYIFSLNCAKVHAYAYIFNKVDIYVFIVKKFLQIELIL